MSIVYYYCSVETYKNMLKSKSVWLTDLTKSNDSQEVVRLYRNIWKAIQPEIISSGIDKALVEQTFINLDSSFDSQILHDIPYGCCFSIKPDLLNMWNEYGDSGKGVCLGFELDWFNINRQYPITSSNLSRAIGYEMVYYDSPQLRKRFIEICCQSLEEQGNMAWLGILSNFKTYAAFIKNPTFEGEQEVRIVYYPCNNFDVSPSSIGLGELCDNVKLHYDLPWYNDNSTALKRIIVGPKCELKEKEIGELITTNNVKVGDDDPIYIYKSDCSYKSRS